ncbi:hypothetical protein BLNAU_8841 [Blattamonas nauphoetae]|uniref:Importin subunit alpha n=1 Tax=Blattamonas nauphoetae TaxID=2049346 RepID=A0ABQ9XXP6_9EUKA|nr:hypothetical protein BLNAU_8841 [Blattamonas nauphoetae]
MSDRANEREASFVSGSSAQDLPETSGGLVSLRRQQRGELLTNIRERRFQDELNTDSSQPLFGSGHNPGAFSKIIPDSELQRSIEGLSSNDPQVVLNMLVVLRKYLLQDQNKSTQQTSDVFSPLIQNFINAGAVGPVLNIIKLSQSEQILEEAAWVITNVACGTRDQCDFLMKSGVVPALKTCLTHSSMKCRAQALWAFSNLALTSTTYVRVIANEHIFLMFPPSFYKPASPLTTTQLRILQLTGALAPTLSEPEFKDDAIRVLPFLVDVIHPAYPTVISSSLQTLGGILNNQTLIDQINFHKLSNSLTKILHGTFDLHPNKVNLAQIMERALGLVGQMCQSDKCIEYFLHSRILSALSTTMCSVNEQIRKKTAFALGNISAGTASHKDMILRTDIVKQYVQSFETEKPNTQSDILIFFMNLSATPSATVPFLTEGVIQLCMSQVRSSNHASTELLVIRNQNMSLTILENVLKFLPRIQPASATTIIKLFEDHDIIPIIEQLRGSSSKQTQTISERICRNWTIIKEYGVSSIITDDPPRNIQSRAPISFGQPGPFTATPVPMSQIQLQNPFQTTFRPNDNK